MADQFSTLSGVRIASGSVTVPLYGLWSGDVQLAADQATPDRVTLVIGNLTMKGYVYRQTLFAGTRTLRIAGGVGGWRRRLESRAYKQASGVKASIVVNDLARESGESVSLGEDRVLGTYWLREGNVAAQRSLRSVVGDQWYVDPAGVTQIRARASSRITAVFQAISQMGGKGIVEISTEDYAAWVPGRTFTSPLLPGTFTVCGLTFKFDNEGTLRMEVATA